MTMNMKYTAPRYPRVIVSGARHKALMQEADKRNISVAALVEEKLKNAPKNK